MNSWQKWGRDEIRVDEDRISGRGVIAPGQRERARGCGACQVDSSRHAGACVCLTRRSQLIALASLNNKCANVSVKLLRNKVFLVKHKKQGTWNGFCERGEGQQKKNIEQYFTCVLFTWLLHSKYFYNTVKKARKYTIYLLNTHVKIIFCFSEF